MSTENDASVSFANSQDWFTTPYFGKGILLSWSNKNIFCPLFALGISVLSPEFTYSSSRWILKLDSHRDKGRLTGTASLFLIPLSPITVKSIWCETKLRLKYSNTRIIQEKATKVCFTSNDLPYSENISAEKLLIAKTLNIGRNYDVSVHCYFKEGVLDRDFEAEESHIASPAQKADDTVWIVSKGSEILLKDIEALFKERKNCDVTLEVGDEKFPAHKLILSARSPVFAAMFEHDTEETRTNTVKIVDIEGPVMRDLLAYIYTGNARNMSIGEAIGLYTAADKYALLNLKTQCAEFLVRNVSLENACDIAILADAHNDGKVIDSIKIFARENPSLLHTEKWKRLATQHVRLAYEIAVAFALHPSSES